MEPGLKPRNLTKLAPISFGRDSWLPLSSPKETLTARHRFSTVHNGKMMLDMNEDIGTFTKTTTGYIGTGIDPRRRGFQGFFLKARNSDSLIIDSIQAQTCSYHSKSWKDKMNERGTTMLRIITGYRSRSQRDENCGSST